MATVKEIKEEMQFNTELMDLLEVMKDIAVFQFRSLQRRRERFKEFALSLRGFFRMTDLSSVSHFYIKPRTEKKAAVIITSDEGFMGGLNFNVLSAALAKSSAAGVKLAVVGERGARYLSEIGREFVYFKGPSPDNIYNLAMELKNYIISGLEKEEFSSVDIFYPKPVSFIVQKVECLDILGIASPPSGIPGTHYFKSNVSPETEPGSVIIESPIEGIIEYLMEAYMLEKLIEVIEDSKLSEFAARAIQLEKSNQGLEEKAKALKFNYFRARHEEIDRNIRDLVSGQIIRKKKMLY